MPLWILLSGALTTVVVTVLMSQLLGPSDEADKPLQPLRTADFTISMPGTPKRSAQPVPLNIVGPAKDLVEPTTATSYASESADKAYIASAVEGPTTAAADLAQAVAGMAAGTGGSVHDSSRSRYHGHPTIDARISGVADDQATMFVRIVHAGERMVVLQAVVEGRDVRNAPPAYRQMLRSLRLRRATSAKTNAKSQPILARKIATPRPKTTRQALAACRRQEARAGAENVRTKVRRLCADAAGQDLESIVNATLAACIAVAAEAGDLEQCGFKVIRP